MRKTFHSTFKKKGSISLSINAIVVVVLAFVMLGLGLTLTRTIFDQVSGGATGTLDQIEEDLSRQLTDSGEKIAFASSNIEVDFRGDTVEGLGISNQGSNRGAYCVAFESRMKDSNANAQIGFFYDDDPQYILAGDYGFLPITIDAEDAPSRDKFRGKITVYEFVGSTKGTTGTELSLEAVANTCAITDSVDSSGPLYNASGTLTVNSEWQVYSQSSFFIVVQ